MQSFVMHFRVRLLCSDGGQSIEELMVEVKSAAVYLKIRT